MKKENPIELLNEIILRMKYDSSMTLSENQKVINEQRTPYYDSQGFLKYVDGPVAIPQGGVAASKVYPNLKPGEYPNYTSWKDRSGNNWGSDASEGNESMWFQHRSGTAVEFHPDGAMHITAHNSRYEVTFGENRMTISGAQDITIKGDASLRVYGDYNVTCHKNYNLSVMGDINITGKNMNRAIRGNMDTQAKNVNKKIEGSINYQSQGAAAYVSKGATTVASQGGKAFFGASDGLHAAVTGEGDMSFLNEKGDMFHETKDGKSDQKYASNNKTVKIMHKDGKTDHTADEEITTKSTNKGITTTAKQDVTTKSESGGIQLKADAGSISAQAQQNIEVKSQQDTHVIAQGHAAMEGASGTTVGNAQGLTNVVGGGSGINIDALGGLLNLAGGAGIPFGGLGQLAFNFLQGDQATGIQDRQATRANQPQEEPDASGEISSWK